MKGTDIVERRPFELDDSEEIRMTLDVKDRIEITDTSANWIVTIQDDGRGHAEISVLEGHATLYT